MRQITDDITVNVGNGLYDNDGLIDSVIVDCNSLIKLLIENQFVAFGNTLAQMVQKLNAVKNGIKADRESMERQIAELVKEINEKGG